MIACLFNINRKKGIRRSDKIKILVPCGKKETKDHVYFSIEVVVHRSIN